MDLLVGVNVGVLVPRDTIGAEAVVLALAEDHVLGLGGHVKLVDEHLSRLLSVTVPEGDLGYGVFVSSDPVHFSVGRGGELISSSREEERVDVRGECSVTNSGLAKSDNKRVSTVDPERNTVEKSNSSSQ